MLTKLIKYDIRSTWRDFAGVYLSILLGVIILPPIFSNFKNPIVNTIAGFLATGIVIATVVVTVITLFKIFNTSVFSRTGYLTMTLPVTSSQIVFSKLLVSTMWIVLTGIVSGVGLLIFILNMHMAPTQDLSKAIQAITDMLSSRGVFAVIIMIVAMLFSTVKEISKLFLACSIAHLKQLSRFRVAAGILSYFVLSWVETLIVQAAMLIVSFAPHFSEYVKQLNTMNSMNNIQQFLGLFNGVMIVGIIYSLVLTAAYAAGTIWILNRKLDLD